MKSLLYFVRWFLLDVISVFTLFIVIGLCFSFLQKCDTVAHAATKIEWKCCAKPPAGTKYINDINVCGISEKREDAEYNALMFCNKLFKTKCEISSCKKVENR